MRVLSQSELDTVSGGNGYSCGGVSWSFFKAWSGRRKSCYSAPKTSCQPKPVCDPAPACDPKPVCKPAPVCEAPVEEEIYL